MRKARHTTKADESPEFVAFWRLWQPHMHPNDGRGAARDEFFRHVEERKSEPADIVDGAAWYIRNRKPEQWMPHAATWLGRMAYEDFADKERDFQRRSAELASKPSNITNFPKGQTAFLRQQKQG